MMEKDNKFIGESITRLASIYRKMEVNFERPVIVNIQGTREIRHREYTDLLACFLKGVKMVSTLHGALVLLESGCVQEVAALCRMVNDLNSEIAFLTVPHVGQSLSPDQTRFLEDFFQEEYDQSDPGLTSQKRATVSVKKIHAALARISEPAMNPSDAQEMHRTMHKSMSGYVHGAYAHIMDMYGGDPPHFHTQGMLGTPRVAQWRPLLQSCVHRSTVTTVGVAWKLGLQEVYEEASQVLREYEQATGFKREGSVRALKIKHEAT